MGRHIVRIKYIIQRCVAPTELLNAPKRNGCANDVSLLRSYSMPPKGMAVRFACWWKHQQGLWRDCLLVKTPTRAVRFACWWKHQQGRCDILVGENTNKGWRKNPPLKNSPDRSKLPCSAEGGRTAEESYPDALQDRKQFQGAGNIKVVCEDTNHGRQATVSGSRKQAEQE